MAKKNRKFRIIKIALIIVSIIILLFVILGLWLRYGFVYQGEMKTKQTLPVESKIFDELKQVDPGFKQISCSIDKNNSAGSKTFYIFASYNGMLSKELDLAFEDIIDTYMKKAIDYVYYRDYLEYKDSDLISDWIVQNELSHEYISELEEYFNLDADAGKKEFNAVFSAFRYINVFLRVDAEGNEGMDYSYRKRFNIYSDSINGSEKWERS